MRKSVTIAASLAIATAIAPIARAANETAPMMQYLGYTSLWQQYGASLANGSNVAVSIAEAPEAHSKVVNGSTVNYSTYYPDITDGRFAGKTMTATSSFTLSQGSSSHATMVGSEFFGNDTGFSTRSVVPKVQNIQMYAYSEFDGGYLLSPGIFPNTPEPYGSPNNSRVASHAYGATDNSISGITRLDYVVQRDDFMQVVDASNWSTQGSAMNAIVCTPAEGDVNTGGTAIKTAAIGTGTPYTAGRVSPDITGPINGSGSDSIGYVSGVVTLLVSRGMTTSSNYSYTTPTTIVKVAPDDGSFASATKAGYVVHSGDTSEVVKAALMAGALRTASAGPTNGQAITDYRVATANQSANGLDYRYGAGMVNAYNSYQIINAGETDGAAGLGTWGGGIGQYGFDYNQHFGGANGSKNIAQYGFTAGSSPGKFMASLVWNVKIAGASTPGGVYDSTATLYNMSLTLTDLTANTVIAQSASLVDNTQNIWTDLTAGDQYMLTVNGVGAAFDWDYGLAWRSEGTITAMAVPEPGTMSLIGLGTAGLLRRRRVAK